MKPGASLINFARGAIVVDDDLCAALDRGALSHAVLDVFATEPLAENSPLWRHPAITVLPHISAPTNRETASRIVAANIARYRATGQIPEAVDRVRGY
jgi:glyoxylate/hydroxypyruvate reductase A